MKTGYKYLSLMIIGLFVASAGLAQDPFTYSGDIFGGGYSNGIAWGDYNNDGFQDLYISNGHQSAPPEKNQNLLYLNNGDGTFDSVTTAGAIISDQFVSGGSTWGDYNNDGNLDLFTAEVYRVAASFPNTYKTIYSLYENNGDGTFTRSDAHGDLTVETEECGASASWADYNNDGYLDLAISTQYIKFSPVKNNNALYLNDGSAGTFTKQSNVVTEQVTQQGGVNWADYDQDGDMDLVTIAGLEFQSSWLFTNNGSSASFSFDSLTILTSQDAKGASWGDYDNDGDFDLYVSISGVNLDAGQVAQKNILFQNNNGTLSQITINGLTTDTLYTNVSEWGDYDNDGDLDIFIGNAGGTTEKQKSYIYENNNDGTFTRLNNTILSDSSTYTRVAAWADFDNDGDLDIAIGRDGKNRLFTNTLNNGNHYINIKLTGATANKSAIGSIIKVKAAISGEAVWMMREISGQTGFASQNSLRAHFGLGDATVIDSIEIDWAGSGAVEYYTNVPADQFLLITEGNASAIGEDSSPALRSFQLNQNYPNPFNPSTAISYQLSTVSDVQLVIYNALGQKVRTLVNGRQEAGEYALTFDASELSSGIYYYKLTAGSFVQIRKMILMK